MNEDALNPRLYRLLKERCEHVRISNQGMKQIGRYRKRAISGEDYLDLIEPGEYYQVCCPYCTDTRFRLYINHMWGRRDERGNRNLWLAICYNEDCLSKPERRAEFLERLTDQHGESLAKTKIVEGHTVDPTKIVSDWPGPVTRVDQLPADHRAVQYLRSRHFDPVKIGKFYNVHYCHASFRWLAQDRLIIPIYLDKVMRGWQARFVGETNWSAPDAPIKYYTEPGTPRRHLVYNLANARLYQTGVIMEGPTDVWSFGPMGVCTLGSTMTNLQINRFAESFKSYPGVLLYDPDVRDDPKKWPSVERMIAKLKACMPTGFAVVWLPGRDPGSLDREFLRDYVAQQARKQKVKVSWQRRAT